MVFLFSRRKNLTHYVFDACLEGMGCIFHDKVYHCKTPKSLLGCHVTVLEMFNIFIAIQKFGSSLKNQTVTIFCDNMSVVINLRTGKTREMILAKMPETFLCKQLHLIYFSNSPILLG